MVVRSKEFKIIMICHVHRILFLNYFYIFINIKLLIKIPVYYNDSY